MLDDGYRRLVQETMNLLAEYSGQNPFEDEQECRVGPGLNYFVSKGVTTMHVKMEAVPDLSDPSSYKEGYRFFKTASLQEAQFLSDRLHLKRFPLFESSFSDITLKSEFWWLQSTVAGATIGYYTHDRSDDVSCKRLGPLGDPKRAFQAFKTLLNELHALYCFEEMSVDENQVSWTISTTKDYLVELLKPLMDIFFLGQLDDDFELIVRHYLSCSSLTYLKEVALLRRFWLKVEGELSRSFT